MSKLIKPVYKSDKNNRSINLGSLNTDILFDDKELSCESQASINLQPTLKLELTADLSNFSDADVFRLFLTNGKTRIQYGQNQEKCDVFVSGTQKTTKKSGRSIKNEKQEASLRPNPQKMTIFSSRRQRLKSATFHIFNFPAFLCTNGATDITHGPIAGKSQRLGRVILEHDGWHIEIQTLPEAEERIQNLKMTGGNDLTHVGKITRKTGKTFSISALQKTMRELQKFLSFARGIWTPVMLPVGFDERGEKSFEEWGIPISENWEPCLTWFDDHHGEALAALYPGFASILRDPNMGDSISQALYWFLRSNRAGLGPGPDGGLILSQAALERLSYAYLEKNSLKTGGKTGEIIQRACDHMGLPTAIPKSTTKLYNAWRAQKRKKNPKAWEHAPHALVDIRNELVHPKNCLGVKIGVVISDAWKLSQWYIALTILRLSDYDGQYGNFLHQRWRGQVEDVPWKG